MSTEHLEAIEIGEDLGQVEYQITEEDVERFLGSVDGYEFAGEALGPDDCVPPLMIGNDYLKVYKPKYSTVGALHARLEMEVLGCMRRGQQVVTRGKILDKYTKRGKTSVVIGTFTTDQQGNPLVNFVVTLTYIF